MIIAAESTTRRVRDTRSIAARCDAEIRMSLLPQAMALSKSCDPRLLPRVDQDIPQGPHLFEGAAGAERNTAERVVGDRDGKAGGVAQHQVQVAEQRAAAGQHDP